VPDNEEHPWLQSLLPALTNGFYFQATPTWNSLYFQFSRLPHMIPAYVFFDIKQSQCNWATKRVQQEKQMQ
jgi:hypothetical protein